MASFNSSDRVQTCDSLRTKTSSVTKKCLKSLYKSLIGKDEKLTIIIVPVYTQKDGSNSRLFTITFSADILQVILTTQSCFDIFRMREHIMECLEQEKLSISKASICCCKQRLQDFWPLIELCRVWQGKKVQIVSKKTVYFDPTFPLFLISYGWRACLIFIN